MNRRDFMHAIRMYEQAIELDPKYALAHAGMADAYSYLYRYDNASVENAENAERSSRMAVELDPDSPEAQAACGTALLFNNKYQEAEKHFRTAILLNPNLYDPYYFYGRACMSAGDMEKAAELFQLASDINPADYLAPSLLSQAYEAMGRKDLARQGRARSTEVLDRHIRMNPDDARALGFSAIDMAKAGDRVHAVERAERALEASGDEPFMLYNAACVYAMLDDRPRALDLLERAVALGWGDRAWILHDSDLAALRDEQRFVALMQRMG